MTFYTYIIESIPLGTWYYGHTNNIKQRLKNHNSGKSTYTKSRGPWKLIFERPFDTKIEAIKFELHLKKCKNKNYIAREYGKFFIRDVASR